MTWALKGEVVAKFIEGEEGKEGMAGEKVAAKKWAGETVKGADGACEMEATEVLGGLEETAACV